MSSYCLSIDLRTWIRHVGASLVVCGGFTAPPPHTHTHTARHTRTVWPSLDFWDLSGGLDKKQRRRNHRETTTEVLFQRRNGRPGPGVASRRGASQTGRAGAGVIRGWVLHFHRRARSLCPGSVAAWGGREGLNARSPWTGGAVAEFAGNLEVCVQVKRVKLRWDAGLGPTFCCFLPENIPKMLFF